MLLLFLVYVLLEYQDRCTVHLINEGVSVGHEIVRVEFAVTGPVSSLTCILDQDVIENCKTNQFFCCIL